MRYLGIVIFLLIIFVFMTTLHIGGAENVISKRKLTKSLTDQTARAMRVKLPRVILRKYTDWANSPRNLSTYLYHSIPIQVTHVKDDVFRLTATYRKTESHILSVQLWMEFPNITPSRKLQTKKYFINITPVISPQDMDIFKYCRMQVFASRARFPGDILEMKFDITSLYEACFAKHKSPEDFTFKLRFYSLNNETDIDLTKEPVDMFLLFKELDVFEDILHLLPNTENLERLHHSTVTRKVPKLKSFSHRISDSGMKVKGAKKCSLKPFVFNFDDSGWRDYVIAPKEYQSNNCRGDCSLPLPDHISSTNYVIIKAVASTVYKGMRNPSCIAEDLAPLTMLVRDEDLKITMKIQKDMIATSCKCA